MRYITPPSSIVNFCENDICMKDFIQSQTNLCGREDKDDPFYVCDLGDIVKKWRRFAASLPMVQPFYAVKCNPDPIVLKLLASLGCNFDCASKGEIKMILDMGINPERIIFANPCKQTSFIKYAAVNNVKKMTFDNELELHKIKQHFLNAVLVIRIRVDDSKSTCKLGIKYGASLTRAADLLKVAKSMNLNVVGVSFHVGSGCSDAIHFFDAVKSASHVFDQAKKIGFNFELLDIGGGFPGVNGEDITFEMAADQLTRAFNKYFQPESKVRIIAEPGRYFVASAFTLSCNITSVREIGAEDNSTPGFMYYLNDGVYGSFNCILFDFQYPKAYSLAGSGQLYKSSVWGPTCDSLDCITKEVYLPKMSIGSWVCFDNMGAYTLAAASRFNGFKPPTVLYMSRRQFWNEVSAVDSPALHLDTCLKLEKLRTSTAEEIPM